MSFDLEIRGKQVLLELRVPAQAGQLVMLNAKKRVYISKLGPDALAAGYKVDDEVLLHFDAKIVTHHEDGKEFAAMRTFEDIACVVKRSSLVGG